MGKGRKRKGAGAPSGSKPAVAAPARLSGPPATPLVNALAKTESTRFEGRSDAFDRVPREYRAQVVGRSQRQFIKAPDLKIWIQEWIERVDSRSPFTTDGLRLIEARIDWRLISNSGVDEGIIRPVIGAGGWPLIPGSGIKGLFRRACPTSRLQRWCGSPCVAGDSPCAAGDLKPGILRFHGAWPSDASWMKGLLDLAHPQQNWQVGFTNGGEDHPAFGVVSLYAPELQVGLSCTDPSITTAEWGEVEQTLRQALRQGIGGRTCVGYGSTGRLDRDPLFQCGLAGQGPIAKLLDGTAEFRPTMFRAAIRGMALRLFGGLCDSTTAQQVVGELFGSLSKLERQNVGLLATAYTDAYTELDSFRKGSWEQDVYATTGCLQWRLTRRCRGGEREELLLRDLLAALHGLTMSLGGFGRGWRRPDHRIFWSHYPRRPLGCHWQWLEPDQLPRWVDVQSADDLSRLLRRARELAAQWLQATGGSKGRPAPWREVIDPDYMRLWIRTASSNDDAVLVDWFHAELKGSVLGGKMNRVGRLWNRLLPLRSGGQTAPVAERKASPMARPASPTARPAALARGGAMARPSAARQAPSPRGEVSIPVHQGPFLETVVLFPDQREAPDFIQSMTRGKGADEGFRPVLF